MNKKEKIFTTALHLFVENGIEKTPTSKIASEAGVATGTLFHHFKNKEELVNALYLEVKARIADAMNKGISNSKDARLILRQMWDGFMEWSISNPELFQFNTLVCESPIITRKTKRQMVDQTFKSLSEFLENAETNRFARDLPYDLLSVLMGSMLTRTAQYFIDHPRAFENSEIVDETFEAYYGMLSKG